jgi:hypothetical protein
MTLHQLLFAIGFFYTALLTAIVAVSITTTLRARRES